ncbi:MAG: hypothetical protein WD009_12065 [Phycisphaeraceae bacterium]
MFDHYVPVVAILLCGTAIVHQGCEDRSPSVHRGYDDLDPTEQPPIWDLVVGRGPSQIGWNTIHVKSDGSFRRLSWKDRLVGDTMTAEWTLTEGDLSSDDIERIWSALADSVDAIPRWAINEDIVDGEQWGISLKIAGQCDRIAYGSNQDVASFDDLYRTVEEIIVAAPGTSAPAPSAEYWLALWAGREPWWGYIGS